MNNSLLLYGVSIFRFHLKNTFNNSSLSNCRDASALELCYCERFITADNECILSSAMRKQQTRRKHAAKNTSPVNRDYLCEFHSSPLFSLNWFWCTVRFPELDTNGLEHLDWNHCVNIFCFSRLTLYVVRKQLLTWWFESHGPLDLRTLETLAMTFLFCCFIDR